MRNNASAALWITTGLFVAVACSAATHAVFAPGPIDAATLARAELLASRFGCAQCHAANERIAAEPAPKLEQVGARLAPKFLETWLRDPHAARAKACRVVDLDATKSGSRDATIAALTQFQASLGGPLADEPLEVSPSDLERGRQLYHSVGCVACHAPQESADDLKAPLWDLKLDAALAPHVATSFVDPATKFTVDSLAKFLADPLSAHPAGRMPSLGLGSDEAQAIALYLERSRAPRDGIVESPGWHYDYFEGKFESAIPGFGGSPIVRSGDLEVYEKLPKHDEDHFGFQFDAFVEVEKAGNYGFSTTSDDGSRVWIDGKLVVDNDGPHAPATKQGDVWLERGRHAISVVYFEYEGGEELAIQWKPPGGELATIPAKLLSHWRVLYAPAGAAKFVVDPKLVERGKQLFGEHGCSTCHMLDGVKRAPSKTRQFAQLASNASGGCLSKSVDLKAPHFDFTDSERNDLRALVSNAKSLDAPQNNAQKLASTFECFDCLACHRRDARGGPSEELQPYFKAAFDVDLGNEGRFPPHLEHVGAKLKREWMAKVFAGAGVERAYLATRMPKFGADNVRDLPKLFADVDSSANDAIAIAFDEKTAEIGRKLAGKSGLGCIQCHYFNGVRSLGIPAVDLAHVSERIQPAWFKRLLVDPKSVGMNSRMPNFWQIENGVPKSSVHDVYDGDPAKQADALWTYLSLGRSMPLPEGIQIASSEYELVVGDVPVMCGVFWRGASPRTIAVGYPEQTHMAFDVENSRLLSAWRGRFFNAEGTWNGRAGGLEKPMGESVFDFPEGPTFALLEKSDSEWPTTVGRDAGYKRLGWRFDEARRPVFRYALGEVEIAEEFVPSLSPGRAKVQRKFELRSKNAVEGLELRLATGKHAQASDGVWSIDELSTVQVIEPKSAKTFVVQSGERAELRLPITFVREGSEFVAHVDLEVRW